MLGSRWSVAKQVSNRVPAGANTGAVPSEPPPAGRIVSFKATRLFCGNTGYRRRAVHPVSDRVQNRAGVSRHTLGDNVLQGLELRQLVEIQGLVACGQNFSSHLGSYSRAAGQVPDDMADQRSRCFGCCHHGLHCLVPQNSPVSRFSCHVEK